ncbi:MAG: hypothetical protein SFY32_09625 [Bacteroidota bacterium]|nr:hypothetical protein [Bacteroidota bacterium]
MKIDIIKILIFTALFNGCYYREIAVPCPKYEEKVLLILAKLQGDTLVPFTDKIFAIGDQNDKILLPVKWNTLRNSNSGYKDSLENFSVIELPLRPNHDSTKFYLFQNDKMDSLIFKYTKYVTKNTGCIDNSSVYVLRYENISIIKYSIDSVNTIRKKLPYVYEKLYPFSVIALLDK